MDPILLDIFISVFIAMFVVVDPIGMAPVLAGMTQGATAAHKRKMAIRGVLVATLILFFFAWVGRPFLEGLGISMAALRVAGGIMLFGIGFEMVTEKRSERKQDTADELQDYFEDISVFPVALPLTAGPGSIATVILLMSQHEGNWPAQAMVLAGLGATMLVTLIIYLMASQVMDRLGPTVNAVITRVLGVIVCALSAQYVLDGLREALFS